MHFLHFQADRSYAHIALFRNVSNSEKLKNRIVSASLSEGELGDKEREALNFAFINARLVSHNTMINPSIYAWNHQLIGFHLDY